MHFSDIVTRLTGISCPVFGVSWNPPEAEVTAAKRVIAFLEDRRVLYNPTELEQPEHCVSSVLQIRAFLTSELGKLDPDDGLAQNLYAMRAACRKFLDQTQEIAFHHRPLPGYSAWVFHSALGEMRGIIGLHVALVAVRNGGSVEEDLASILPAQGA